MNYIFNFLIFTFGTSIVSFLTVIAHEYPHIDPIRRSQCDSCQRTLHWFEIIPIWSYLIAKGNCKTCNKPIDKFYPLTEMVGGLFLLVASLTHQNLTFVTSLFTVLTLLAFSDHFFGYVYLSSYLLFVPIIILNIQHLYFIPALIVYTLLMLLNYLYEGIGSGDIEILTILAILVGFDSILKIILLACFLCLVNFYLTYNSKFRFIPYITISTAIILILR
ncbi:prepilin peptidase [Companilactobacillus keshanensis]|uniref:Prepilin peptidase n=1 Tax=Companilactobacillus keshanensis TaxID=2486003 RepID=A0ABW4BTQ0_9LACO